MNAHYRLGPLGNIEIAKAATDEPCIAYLIERAGSTYLCVMEGAAYHQFELGPLGMLRLVSEGSSRLLSLAQGAGK